jgi:endonuclease YncB( thermonuclease family)
MKRFALLLLLFLSFSPSALASSRLEGPVPAQLIRVIDGDTVEVEIKPWFGVRLITRVRLYGIDAPELHSPCADERARAEAARDFLQGFVGAEPVYLNNIRRGKYYGRVIASLSNHEGKDASEALLASGHASPYHGGRRTTPSCPLAGIGG